MISRFRPLRLENWDGPTTPPSKRKSRHQFRAGYHDTVNLLDREIEHLGAKQFIIEADFRETDIRLDGMPRANARQPDFPGVRVFFESRHGPLVYQTDKYDGWRENLRAIALGLEALRAVDRYGITNRAEQYTGFKAIESGKPKMTKQQAQDLIDSYGGLRQALRHSHPDNSFSGSREAWDAVQEARNVLGI